MSLNSAKLVVFILHGIRASFLQKKLESGECLINILLHGKVKNILTWNLLNGKVMSRDRPKHQKHNTIYVSED